MGRLTGDVLLTTPAIRRFKALNPDVDVVFHTRKFPRSESYSSSYDRGAPGEMLHHNSDLAYVMDWGERPKPEWEPTAAVTMHYAGFGGPSLDYPIQAHYYENLGLAWEPGQRFDAIYQVTDEEREWAERVLPSAGEPYLVLTPHTGWLGKGWRREAWLELAVWATDHGYTPVIMAGERQPQFTRRGTLNLAGDLTWRQNGAILERAQHMVATEGGLSNLRAAVGGKQLLLTCATQVGVAVWYPPELIRELRWWRDADGNVTADDLGGEPACESCMWRREHVKFQRGDVPPASLAQCPAGISLRDLPVSVVTNILEEVTR
jgi:hypothetical protein